MVAVLYFIQSFLRAFVFFEHNFQHSGQDLGGGDEGLKKTRLSRNEMQGNESEEKNTLLQFQVFCSTSRRNPNPLFPVTNNENKMDPFQCPHLRGRRRRRRRRHHRRRQRLKNIFLFLEAKKMTLTVFFAQT